MAGSGGAGAGLRPKIAEKPESATDAAIENVAAARIDPRWEKEAWALAGRVPAPRVPFDVMLNEAPDAAAFCQRYREPRELPGGEWLPGLSVAYEAGRLSPTVDEELIQLVEAFRAAHVRCRLLADKEDAASLHEAREVQDQLKTFLEYCAEEEPGLKSELQYITRTHGGGRTRAVFTLTLHEYAALAERRQARLEAHGLPPDLIQRAYSLQEALHAKRPRPPPPEQGLPHARELRNRLARLIELRLRAVRTAARFVFRDHPDIVRKVTSAYRRNRQAKWREKREE